VSPRLLRVKNNCDKTGTQCVGANQSQQRKWVFTTGVSTSASRKTKLSSRSDLLLTRLPCFSNWSGEELDIFD